MRAIVNCLARIFIHSKRLASTLTGDDDDYDHNYMATKAFLKPLFQFVSLPTLVFPFLVFVSLLSTAFTFSLRKCYYFVFQSLAFVFVFLQFPSV